ncbi:hypothetical protein [Streptomyces sp. NRRL S-237]|uniref:hypothetical protein n=1 Tax=Streptomyces sp. NRRL S-237 TaxID=1463895 RepID=UPI0004CBF951|nr:hypothetical protein [Streptomyces sp. NRRL S-237]
MSEFWTRKVRAAQESERQAQEEAMAAQLTYRNPNLGAHAQQWIDGRVAKDERNRAGAASAWISYYNVEEQREAAHLRAVQQYHATAHRQERGRLSELEPNPTDMSQYVLNRPRGSYSDVW